MAQAVGHESNCSRHIGASSWRGAYPIAYSSSGPADQPHTSDDMASWHPGHGPEPMSDPPTVPQLLAGGYPRVETPV